MKTRLSVCFFAIVLCAACNKKEPGQVKGSAVKEDTAQCGKEFIADKPVKAGETGIILPIGTRICIPKDQSEIRVELPAGYTFTGSATEPITNSTQPVPIATYHCGCSGDGSFCQVFYGDDLGFGCLHSSCTGTCEGAFGYKGYSLDKVLKLPGTDSETKTTFLSNPEVQKEISKQFDAIYKNVSTPDFNALANNRLVLSNYVYLRSQVFGVSFYLLIPREQMKDEAGLLMIDPLKASCDCNGTKACILKTLSITTDKPGGAAAYKIYYCDGHCNDCELTVNSPE